MSLKFETIVQVRIAPLDQLHKTGRQIKREKEGAPPFVLLHVDMLVRTNATQDHVINPDYHVAKGNRAKPKRRRKKRYGTVDLAAGHFHDAVDKADCRPHAQCNGREYQSWPGELRLAFK